MNGSQTPLAATAGSSVGGSSLNMGGRIGLALIPFTPVPFEGNDMLLAIGRIALYSTVAYFTYNKMRPVSYIAMSAAGVSLAASLMAGMWKKNAA